MQGWAELVRLTKARASNTEQLKAHNLQATGQRLTEQVQEVFESIYRAAVEEKVTLPAAMRDCSLALAQIYIGNLHNMVYNNTHAYSSQCIVLLIC